MKEKSFQGKIVVIGDGASGKTCLLEVFRKKRFPKNYIPTVIDNFSKTITVDGKKVELTPWDTAGQEEFNSIRPLAYKDTSIIFLCYSIDKRDMLINIREKWIFEIKNYCPKTPFFLVALKSDIRSMPDSKIDKSNLIKKAEGKNLAKEIGAKAFFECSALKGTNVDQIFKSAGSVIINSNIEEIPERREFCCCGLF